MSCGEVSRERSDSGHLVGTSCVLLFCFFSQSNSRSFQVNKCLYALINWRLKQNPWKHICVIFAVIKWKKKSQAYRYFKKRKRKKERLKRPENIYIYSNKPWSKSIEYARWQLGCINCLNLANVLFSSTSTVSSYI